MPVLLMSVNEDGFYIFQVLLKMKRKKKEDLGLKGMQHAKLKIFTIWYHTEKVCLSSLRPSELLFELEEIFSAHGGKFSVIKTSVILRLFCS